MLHRPCVRGGVRSARRKRCSGASCGACQRRRSLPQLATAAASDSWSRRLASPSTCSHEQLDERLADQASRHADHVDIQVRYIHWRAMLRVVSRPLRLNPWESDHRDCVTTRSATARSSDSLTTSAKVACAHAKWSLVFAYAASSPGAAQPCTQYTVVVNAGFLQYLE